MSDQFMQNNNMMVTTPSNTIYLTNGVIGNTWNGALQSINTVYTYNGLATDQLSQFEHGQKMVEVPDHEFTSDVSGQCTACYWANIYRGNAATHPHWLQEEQDDDDWRDQLAL